MTISPLERHAENILGHTGKWSLGDCLCGLVKSCHAWISPHSISHYWCWNPVQPKMFWAPRWGHWWKKKQSVLPRQTDIRWRLVFSLRAPLRPTAVSWAQDRMRKAPGLQTQNEQTSNQCCFCTASQIIAAEQSLYKHLLCCVISSHDMGKTCFRTIPLQTFIKMKHILKCFLTETQI